MWIIFAANRHGSTPTLFHFWYSLFMFTLVFIIVILQMLSDCSVGYLKVGSGFLAMNLMVTALDSLACCQA